MALLLLLAGSVFAQDAPAPRVGLVTMTPGAEYWAKFGHNAILIDDGQQRTLYNFGYFDFEQEDFLLRFLRGRMLYRLLAIPLEHELRSYAADGRGMSLQWLNFDAAQARSLATALQRQARPENAEYRYDYFTENCSTKVRDALDAALGGELRRTLAGRSHGYTYRDEALRLAAPLPWMALGIHLGLGPFVDQRMSLWEESYVPERLRDAVRDAKGFDGGPLVSSEEELLPAVLPLAPDTPPQWRTGFVVAGLLLALAFAWGLRAGASRALRRTTAAGVALLWLLCGLAGCWLLGLWAFTDHVAAWGNENAWLFNPFCLLLLAAVPTLMRGGGAPRWLARIGLLVALCAGFALFLKFLPFRIQSNGDWIALLLPVHIVLALRLYRVTST